MIRITKTIAGFVPCNALLAEQLIEVSKKCHYCDKTRDLRPYGPRGAMVCFGCAMRSPERKAETERNFSAQLEAAGPVACIDGTEVGPYLAKHAAPGPNPTFSGLSAALLCYLNVNINEE